MTTFVLVPGAWRGGWTFEPLARELRGHGHQAYPVTLTGVGGRKHLPTASVNLDTPIEDVVNLLVDEGITDEPVRRRLPADPAWRVHPVDSGHDVMGGAPEGLLRILLEAADAA